MNFQLPVLRWSLLPAKIRGMFNLNDPRWGRDDDKSSADSGNKPAGDPPSKPDAWPQGSQGRGNPQSGPPDLDELWRDFNRKLGQIRLHFAVFGAKLCARVVGAACVITAAAFDNHHARSPRVARDDLHIT